MFGRGRLQSKLIFAFIFVSLIPTGIIAFYSINTASNTLIGKINAEESQLVSSEASTIRTRLLNIANDVLFLSEASQTRSYLPVLAGVTDSNQAATQEELAFFESFLKRSPQYVDISILDIGGQERLHVTNRQPGNPISVTPDQQTQAGSSYYQQAIALPAGQIYISLFNLHTTDGKIDQPYVPFIAYSAPLHSDTGSIRGILILKALLNPILSDEFFQDRAGETYLVDNDGSYIFQPDSTKLYNRVLQNGATLDKDQPNDLSLLYGSDQGTLLSSKDRPDSLQVFAHITIPGQMDVQWLLIRQEAISSILSEVNRSQLVIAIIAGFALLIAVVVASVLAYTIVHPVRQLVRVANAVSQGDWSITVPPIKTKDEIAQLAGAFDKMLRELQVLYSGLESRVKERTIELEATNKQLIIAQEKAEHASRAKSIFLSNVSHELRTPLNVIIGYSSSVLNMPQMFENVELPPVHRPVLDLIEMNGRYLLGLINDILDLSKIESGNFELRFAPVNLKEIFQGVISTSIGLLKDKPLQLQSDYPDDLPYVWADALRVRQIVLNLMSNAIKFTDTGRVTISARVEGQFVRISVIDTGIGIPENALAKIFDRFKQVEHEADKYYGGTGLGLDISKQLCLLHHSDLTVQSTLGKGSTFSFLLPLTTAEQLSVKANAIAAESAAIIFDPTIVSKGSEVVILLAEEDAVTRDMLRFALEEVRYVVVDTNDGQHALDLAAGMLPTLMILDVDLPSMSGWEVLQSLKADPKTKSVPIIVCAEQKEPDYLALPGVWYVQKPIKPVEVLSAIDQILHRLPTNNKGVK